MRTSIINDDVNKAQPEAQAATQQQLNKKPLFLELELQCVSAKERQAGIGDHDGEEVKKSVFSAVCVQSVKREKRSKSNGYFLGCCG